MEKSVYTYIKLAIVATFVILVAVQANKSFVLDEIDFPIVSEATSKSGAPIYYRGEVRPEHVGIYHPTFYINSAAAFVRFFGFNEASMRMFGVICTLVSILLLVLLLRKFITKNEKAETLLLALFLLNPFTLASTTLPDIDSTLLPVVILTFIYAAIVLVYKRQDASNKAILVLSTIFALSLWTKLTTPLILPPFLLLLHLISFDSYKKSIIFTTKVVVIGAVSFLLTYFLYTKALGLSFTYTFTFLLESFTKGTDSGSTWGSIITNLTLGRKFLLWMTIPILSIFGISAFTLLSRKNIVQKNKDNLVIKLLIALCFFTTFFYIALIAPFGGFFKYPFPVFGLVMVTIVLYYHYVLRKIDFNPVYAVTSVLIGMVINHVYWKDSMFLVNSRLFEGFYYTILFIVAVYLLVNLSKGKLLYAAKYMVITGLFFSIGYQFNISRVQAIKPYPTKYHYGQLGMDDTTSYLRTNTQKDEIIWSMKDVGYYTNNRYIESYVYYFNPELEEELVSYLQGGEVRYYVVTNGIGQDNINAYPDIKRILDENAKEVERFGDFIIYKAKE